jgi:lipoyl(octanoyl) transferase
MKLHHFRLPAGPPIPYSLGSTLQERLVQRFLLSKSTPSLPAPPPTILTFEFTPTYTLGRREAGTLTPFQLSHLRAAGKAAVHETLRGGQTTFHGPGQLVAYPILDLKRHGLSPRCYVALLEKTLIATCARYGIRAFTTEHTGVWTSADEKIAAIGVHMRRNVTSHGVGLNVGTDLGWFERVVACGLEGKRVTSFEAQRVRGRGVKEVGEGFVEEFARALEGVSGVVMVEGKDVLEALGVGIVGKMRGREI